MLEPLNDSEWRVFRLLIRDLPDRELEAVEQQLQREMIHRQECDRMPLKYISCTAGRQSRANTSWRKVTRVLVVSRRRDSRSTACREPD